MAAGSQVMAAGSHATFGIYPRVCSGCGERVKITGRAALWFETVGGVPFSWHFACRLGLRSGGLVGEKGNA